VQPAQIKPYRNVVYVASNLLLYSALALSDFLRGREALAGLLLYHSNQQKINYFRIRKCNFTLG
jgi:hypothetical protein